MNADDYITCSLCPRHCRLREGGVGACRARGAKQGAVRSLSYGKITSIALDPIEKKPLVRFLPGSKVLSVGSFGCNLACPFCQNASIAQRDEARVSYREIAPRELVQQALELRTIGCVGIAYTYNEPLVGYEYVLDCAQLAHDAGLVNVLVSNGCIEQEPLRELAGYIDAANIDLKGFTQQFYDLVKGNLAAVKATIELLGSLPTCHLEVTTLVIADLNDSDSEVEAAARWLASIDPAITYHLTRFFPSYRMQDKKPTPLETLRRLRDAASRHLDDVVLGNC